MVTLIYRIYDEIDCYVGSTLQSLKDRMSCHKKKNNNCCSKIIIKRGNYESEILEETDENNRGLRENYWMDKISTLKQVRSPIGSVIYIYKIFDELDCYVGSTADTLNGRFSKHNSRLCKAHIIIDRGNAQIEEIETTDRNNRYEREQHWIDKLSTLNQKRCYIPNRETYWHDKYLKDKDTISIRAKQRHADNRTELNKISRQYYADHKEEEKLKHKQYKLDHKEEILEKANEKTNCECGGKYIHNNKKRHLETLKHLAFLALVV